MIARRPTPQPLLHRARPSSRPPVRAAAAVAAVAVAVLTLGACAPAPAGRAPVSANSPVVPSPASSTRTPSTSPAPRPAPTPIHAATPAATPAATAAPAALTRGATGERVRELQARLTQLAWFTGPTTGAYDAATVAAVRGFQDKRTLPATGSTDAATWASLVHRTRTPTRDELHNTLTPGPALLRQGATGPVVRDLQARLKQIGWWSGPVGDSYGPQTVDAVRQFQAKRAIPVTGEVDQRTSDRLRSMTRTPTSDELTNTVPRPPTGTTVGLDPRCLTGRVLCIGKDSRSLTWVVDGTARMRLDVRFGSENHPTREGVFSVFRKNREWTSTLYGSSMPFSMFFSGGEAVHYSSDFAARGYAGASHGCVNVRDYEALSSLFDLVQVGDTVVVS